MWRIFQSQRMERLFDALLSSLDQPLKDPMAPEVIVVQDMGMARWLTHRLAQSQSIAANIQFLVPAALVDLVYRAWLGDEVPSDESAEAWDPHVLTWRIFKLLDVHKDDERFRELAHYTADDPSGMKRFQLASRIAAAFDRYLVYRQDMLASWESEEHGTDWQAHLWRLLVQEINVPHQGHKHRRFLEAVRERKDPRQPENLPERVSLFGVTFIAPVHFSVFDCLASRIDVALYFFNPSREYWGDVGFDKARAHDELLQWNDRAGGFPGNGTNPLVASWAKSGAFLFELIQGLECDLSDCFESVPPESLLKKVQNGIFTLTDRRKSTPDEREVIDDFTSLQVHVCHSPMREIQVLHDRIAYFLEKIPSLTPQDIVVMAPDIDTYAPYVEAVFGTRDNPRLPWNLSDRKFAEEDPLMERILDLLRLPQWRFTATEVLSLLETPAVAARYGFDEKGLDCVRMWVQEAGIRWGLDEAMREELELPRDRDHTWGMGLDRLFAGYALPPQEIFWGGILSYPHVEASDASWLGALKDLLDRLAQWRERLQARRTPEEWVPEGHELVDEFFHPDAEESLSRFRQTLDHLSASATKAGFSDPISIDVLRAYVEGVLASSPNIRRLLSGGITFCNLVPMRAIPFRVVCLLGMNDADFPRADHLPSFDVTAQNPKPGDRRRRLEDRHLFLEALMSARDVFYVSYIGRDIRDNSLRVPSVVVSELLDYVDQSFRTSEGGILEQIVIEHPLQPFSPRLYDGSDPRLFSYDGLWLESACACEKPDPPSFMERDKSFPEPVVEEVSLDDLVRFFDNPALWFLEKRLGLALPRDEETIEDQEPFDADGLQEYRLKVEILESLIRNENPEQIRRLLKARGWLPHGIAGELVFQEILESVKEMAQMVQVKLGASRRTVEIDVPVGSICVRGWLRDVTERGRLVYRPAAVRAKDRLRLWIRHLALCLARPGGVQLESLYIGTGKNAEYRLDVVDKAQEYLTDLVSLWIEGNQRPLPFFPESSWTYVKNCEKKTHESPPARVCGTAWKDEYTKRGEAYDPAVRIAFRGLDPLDRNFVEIAHRVFDPLPKTG